MKMLVAVAAVAAVVGCGTARAQTTLDHNVQKTWDNLFDPGPPGDPRTNWERREDYRRTQYEADQRRQAEHADWCRYHQGADSCRAYGYAPGPYYGR